MSRYIPRRAKSYEKSTLISKGATDVLKIDKDAIEKIIQELRKNQEIVITQANYDLSEKIRRVKDYVKQFHNTSSYNEFYNILIKNFSTVTNPLPGTIGAFCIGNYTFKGDIERKYAITCYDSIPLPNSPLCEKYENTLILIYKDVDYSICKPIFYINNSNPAYVFIMGDGQTSLSSVDINHLTDLNISDYYLYCYENGIYKALSKDLLNVNRCLTTSITKKKKNRKLFVGGDVMFLVALSLVLLFVLLGVSIRK